MADGEAFELRPIKFQVETPGETADILATMARNEARELPEAVRRKTCVIIASGPSARHATPWKALRDMDATIVACNNGLKLCLEHGITPDYWTCCDPQASEVLNFVPDHPPRHTAYLLATKCPESLFDRLQAQNLNVKKWRLDDYAHASSGLQITTAVSITLVTQSLFRLMGYHRFETYGWDCCFLNGEHHATPQPEVGEVMPLELQTDDGQVMGTFETTGSWLAELNDACIQAHNLKAQGYELIVHGPGAVAAILKGKRLIAAT